MPDLPTPAELSHNYSVSPTFYTPIPLVRGILRGIDWLLKSRYDEKMGVFSPNLEFLDPAAGSLNFPLELLRFANRELKSTDFDQWLFESFFKKNVAFEIDPRVVDVGTQQIQDQLHLWGIQNIDRRAFIEIYKMNTLIDPQIETNISNPNQKGVFCRNHLPRNTNNKLIIFGNPPYAVSSQTKSSWISTLIQDYRIELNSGNSKQIVGLKGIQDDYVKFLRFAQWKLADQNHSGIIAFVINNYFLDGMIFRGLRASFQKSFNEIWVINLHGDPKKRQSHSSKQEQKSPLDENVFDIQTGICLFFGIRHSSSTPKGCDIHYSESYGTKTEKFAFVDRQFDLIPFESVFLQSNYEFCPLTINKSAQYQEYLQFTYLPDIFYQNMVGGQSLHDTLATHPDRTILEKNLHNFLDGTFLQREFKDQKGQIWYKTPEVVYHDGRDWKIALARDTTFLQVQKNITLWNWRGFDRWWVAFDSHIMTRGSSSYHTLQYLLPYQHNWAIGSARVSRRAPGGSSYWITDIIAESHFIEGGFGIGDYLFPLRINKSTDTDDWNLPKSAIHSNISTDFKLKIPYRNSISDEDLFFYCYGILWCTTYRSQYQIYLKQDFPRIPFPQNKSSFQIISGFGRRLGEYHTLTSSEIKIDQWSHGKIKDPAKDFRILRPAYVPIQNRIYFQSPPDPTGFWIGDITPAMWNFEIGGNLQIFQWLKHRRFSPQPKRFGFHRHCEWSEIEWFLRICAAIKLTLSLLPDIDREYRTINPIKH